MPKFVRREHSLHGQPIHDLIGILYFTTILVQTTKEKFTKTIVNSIKRINSVISQLSEDPNFVVKFSKLGTISLQLQEHSDVSHTTNHDVTSQIGHFIFMAHKQ